jgi:hypothetical protein
MTVEIRGERIDPAEVTAVRQGNALGPGLAAFTGVSFLVYLLVKWASGATPFGADLLVQLAVSAALLVAGGALLARARYFYVVVETRTGRRKFSGLSRAEQAEIRDRLAPR